MATARTISLSGDVSGSASFDGSANASITTTVADNSHNHNASNITAGTLGVARGGTGLTASPSMLTNLASTTAANVLVASPRPGVTGTLPIANGGTGATTVAGVLTNLGLTKELYTGTYTGGLEYGETKTVDLGVALSWVIVFPSQRTEPLTDYIWRYEYKDYDDVEWGNSYHFLDTRGTSIGIAVPGSKFRAYNGNGSSSDTTVVCLELNGTVLTVGNADCTEDVDEGKYIERYKFAYSDTYAWIGGI